MQRRNFLKQGSLLAGAVALGSVANGLAGCAGSKKLTGNKPFGLQLYTLRDDFPKDPRGVLKQVADMGYKHVESFEGPKGIFWGMSNTEFKKYMDDLGMQIVSSHCDINKNFEEKAAQAAAIGMSYLICPYLGPQKSIDDYKRAADTFNARGEVCKKAGLRFAYHNHDYSFKPVDGVMPQDVMMQSTDPGLVDYEMDIYWVVTAGQNPEDWFKKYPNRFRLSHVKDRKKSASASETFESVTLGTGTIDWHNVLDKAEDKGMRFFIVEQEKYEGTTPLQAVAANAQYMKNLRY